MVGHHHLRGYARVQRLLKAHEWPEFATTPAQPIPVWMLASDREVLVECTAALIEELHDALDVLGHPMIIVKECSSP